MIVSSEDVERLAQSKQIRELWVDVQSRRPFDLAPSADQYWAVDDAKAGRRTILFAPHANPAAALTHELLHLQIQADGYRRIRTGCSSLQKKLGPDWWGQFIGDMDNVLQHLRMYPRFLALGFPSHDFGADSAESVRDCLGTLLGSSVTEPCDVVNAALTLSGTRGLLSDSEIDNYRRTLLQKGERNAESIMRALQLWERESHFNAESTVKDIIHALEQPSKTWFSYDYPANFSANGFFVDQSFFSVGNLVNCEAHVTQKAALHSVGGRNFPGDHHQRGGGPTKGTQLEKMEIR